MNSQCSISLTNNKNRNIFPHNLKSVKAIYLEFSDLKFNESQNINPVNKSCNLNIIDTSKALERSINQPNLYKKRRCNNKLFSISENPQKKGETTVICKNFSSKKIIESQRENQIARQLKSIFINSLHSEKLRNKNYSVMIKKNTTPIIHNSKRVNKIPGYSSILQNKSNIKPEVKINAQSNLSRKLRNSKMRTTNNNSSLTNDKFKINLESLKAKIKQSCTRVISKFNTTQYKRTKQLMNFSNIKQPNSNKLGCQNSKGESFKILRNFFFVSLKNAKSNFKTKNSTFDVINLTF